MSYFTHRDAITDCRSAGNNTAVPAKNEPGHQGSLLKRPASPESASNNNSSDSTYSTHKKIRKRQIKRVRLTTGSQRPLSRPENFQTLSEPILKAQHQVGAPFYFQQEIKVAIPQQQMVRAPTHYSYQPMPTIPMTISTINHAKTFSPVQQQPSPPAESLLFNGIDSIVRIRHKSFRRATSPIRLPFPNCLMPSPD